MILSFITILARLSYFVLLSRHLRVLKPSGNEAELPPGHYNHTDAYA